MQVEIVCAVCVRFRIYYQERPMLDVVMLVIGLAFFALSVGYTFACDRL
jgi:hypothetical protein